MKARANINKTSLHPISRLRQRYVRITPLVIKKIRYCGHVLTGYINIKQSILVSEALWTLVTGLLRVAASLLMRSLTKGTHDRVVHRSAIGIMVLSVALATASIIQIFLICQPFAAQWDPQVLGTCGDQVTSFLVIETAGLLLDIGILTLPPVIIMRLMTPTTRKMKVQVVLVLNIGAV